MRERMLSAFLNPLATIGRIKRAILAAPYRDSGQISLNASVTFSPFLTKQRDAVETHARAFRDLVLHHSPEVEDALQVIEKAAKNEVFDRPTIHLPARRVQAATSATTYSSFAPNRVVIVEYVTATFIGKDLPDKTLSKDVSNASDVILTGLFFGRENWFPNAPSSDNGIHAPALCASPSPLFKLPKIFAGVPTNAHFSVDTITTMQRFVVPDGYNEYPKTVTVGIFMGLFGPLT